MLLQATEIIGTAFLGSFIFMCVPSMAPTTFGRSVKSSKVSRVARISLFVEGNLMYSFFTSHNASKTSWTASITVLFPTLKFGPIVM